MKISTKLFSTFLINISLFTFTFIVSVVLSRSLGPEHYGQYRYIFLVVSTLVLVLSFGVPGILEIKLAQKKIDLRYYIRKSLSFVLPISILICLLGLSFVFKLSTNIDRSLVYISIVLYFAYLLNSIFHNAVYALDNIKKFQIIEILKQSSFLTIIFILYLSKNLTLTIILYAFIFINLFGFFYIVYIMLRKKYQVIDNQYTYKQIFKDAFKVYANNLLTFMTYRVDLFILKMFVGFYEIGIYTLAVNLAEKIWIFPDSIKQVVYLEIANKRQNEFFVAKIIRLLSLSLIFIFFIIAVISFYLIPLVFSEKFRPSIYPFLLLLPGVILFCYSKILSSYFIAKDMIEVNTYSSILITAVNVTFNFLLIPKFTIYGAAIATTLAYLTGAVYHLIKFRMLSMISIKNLLIIKQSDLDFIKPIILKYKIKRR